MRPTEVGVYARARVCVYEIRGFTLHTRLKTDNASIEQQVSVPRARFKRYTGNGFVHVYTHGERGAELFDAPGQNRVRYRSPPVRIKDFRAS